MCPHTLSCPWGPTHCPELWEEPVKPLALKASCFQQSRERSEVDLGAPNARLRPCFGPILHLGLWPGAWAFATLCQLLPLEQSWTPFRMDCLPALCQVLWVPGRGSAWASEVDRPTGWRARLTGRQTPQGAAQPLAHLALPPPPATQSIPWSARLPLCPHHAAVNS